ncbi:MAG: type II toxin-antitoxin system VapC family toxin [Actinomycetota bacterium]
MTDLLVDTDVLVDHLRGRREFQVGTDRVYHSILTRVELFAGRPEREEEVRDLLAGSIEVGVGPEVAERAGRIRRESGLGLADAVIAATALHLGVSVLTRNRRDFDRVPQLRVRTPR